MEAAAVAPASASGGGPDPPPADPPARDAKAEAAAEDVTPAELSEWVDGTDVDVNEGDGKGSVVTEDVSGARAEGGGGGGGGGGSCRTADAEEEQKDGEGGYGAAATAGEARAGDDEGGATTCDAHRSPLVRDDRETAWAGGLVQGAPPTGGMFDIRADGDNADETEKNENKTGSTADVDADADADADTYVLGRRKSLDVLIEVLRAAADDMHPRHHEQGNHQKIRQQQPPKNPSVSDSLTPLKIMESILPEADGGDADGTPLAIMAATMMDDNDINKDGDREQGDGGGGGEDVKMAGPSVSNPPAPRDRRRASEEPGVGRQQANPPFDDRVVSAPVAANSGGGEGGIERSAVTGAPSSHRRGAEWRSAKGDLPARREMVRCIAAIFKSRKRSGGSPPTARWMSDLPHKSKRLEERLYLTAPSLEDYLDRRTIKARLGAAARNIAVQHEEMKKRKRNSTSDAVAGDPSAGGGGKRAKKSAIGGAGPVSGAGGGGGGPPPPPCPVGKRNAAAGNTLSMGRFDSAREQILNNIREQKHLLLGLGHGTESDSLLRGGFDSVREQILHNIQEQKQLLLGVAGRADRLPRQVNYGNGHGRRPAAVSDPTPANVPVLRNDFDDASLFQRRPSQPEVDLLLAPTLHRTDSWCSPPSSVGVSAREHSLASVTPDMDTINSSVGRGSGVAGMHVIPNRADSPPITPESFNW